MLPNGFFISLTPRQHSVAKNLTSFQKQKLFNFEDIKKCMLHLVASLHGLHFYTIFFKFPVFVFIHKQEINFSSIRIHLQRGFQPNSQTHRGDCVCNFVMEVFRHNFLLYTTADVLQNGLTYVLEQHFYHYLPLSLQKIFQLSMHYVLSTQCLLQKLEGEKGGDTYKNFISN